jgi:hypothetical protein
MGCTTRFFLHVNYRSPGSSKDLDDKTVYLEIKDMRSDKTILGKRAEKDFKDFTGLFSLTIDKGEKEALAAGGFNLPSLFKTAFSYRMERMGLHVLKNYSDTAPVIEIALQEFFLDLVARKWILKITYEASLIRGGSLIARETISGKAERVKILGQGDAEKVIGDLFTNVVNDLDIPKLLDQTQVTKKPAADTPE